MKQEKDSSEESSHRTDEPFEEAKIGQDESGPMHAPRLSL